MPEGTQRILNTRSLRTDHRWLAERLRPGMKVLDIGCGTGAITEGIAGETGPGGMAIGVDINPALFRQAERHAGHPAVFVVADAYRLPFSRRFDIVTAARVLQWLSRPIDAIRALCEVTRTGGTVIVLDYNHEKIRWEPEPPASMRTFYHAFLAWRADAGMDNALADHVATMFTQADLIDVQVLPQHETSNSQDPAGFGGPGIWAEVAATRGHQMVADGFITEACRATAEAEYRAWIRTTAVSQTMYLLAVEGRVPDNR